MAPGPGTRNVLALEAVRLTRNGRDRLRDVGLRLASGEILGIAGVAGNGQDELFAVIAGVERPSAGEIVITGTPTSGLSARDVAGSASATCRTTVQGRTGAGFQHRGKHRSASNGTGAGGPARSAISPRPAAGERAMRTYSIVARGPDTPAGACRAVMPRR